MTIPRSIHRIWIQGFESIPTKFAQCQLSVEKLCSYGYTKYDWTGPRIEKLLASKDPRLLEMYSGIQRMDQKSDVARVVILYYFGGWYLDMDVQVVGDLSSINPPEQDKSNQDRLLLMRSPIDFFHSYTLQNCFLASSAGHPFWKFVIDEMLSKNEAPGSKFILECCNKFQPPGVVFINWPQCCFLFSNHGDYLPERPNSKTVLVVNQNLASAQTNLTKLAIMYSRVRNKYMALTITVVVILLCLIFW